MWLPSDDSEASASFPGVALLLFIVPTLFALSACLLNTTGRLRAGDGGVTTDADHSRVKDGDAAFDGDHNVDRDGDVADFDSDVASDNDVADSNRNIVEDADPDEIVVCSSTDERCDGNLRILCVSGALQREDCSPERHCDETVDGPVCVENVCDPGSARCSSNRSTLVICDARGAEETRIPCSRGCAGAACTPETPCDAEIFTTMSSGTVTVDLCGAGTDQAHTNACPWDEQSPSGEDVLIRLEVDRAQDIRIQAYQVSSGETIDPTLYLRSDCDDMSSEIWCREDTNDQDEDFTEAFEPGNYFLVIDRHERSTTSCGELEVVITPL